MKKVASDVGGTFTDLVFFDQKTNRIKTAKTLTTVNNPSDGVIKSIDLASFENPLIKYFCHGGTTVINSITERKGSITALLTTKGFRDVLEIGRGNRPDLYNLHTKSPTPFVPRYLRFEIDERIDANGKVIRKLNLKDLDKIIKLLKKNKVESLAIVFINSYLNQIHEKKCQEIIKKRFPSLYLTASFEISRQWREYERTNTSVLNAFVKPKMNKYLNDLSYKLKKKSFNFHARFSAKQRIYTYIMFNRISSPSIEKNRGWHIKKKLDLIGKLKVKNVLLVQPIQVSEKKLDIKIQKANDDIEKLQKQVAENVPKQMLCKLQGMSQEESIQLRHLLDKLSGCFDNSSD